MTLPLDDVDDGPGLLLGQCGTAPAAAQFVIFAQMARAGIVGAVHHDGPLAGIAVLAWAQAVEAQRIAVLALIGLGGAIDPERALHGIELVGKLVGSQLARVATMADPGVVEQLVALHVDDEQPAHGRGFAVVDNGENGFALVAHALVTGDGLAKYLFVELAGQPQLAVEILIPAGVAVAAKAERPQQQRQPSQSAPQRFIQSVCFILESAPVFVASAALKISPHLAG